MNNLTKRSGQLGRFLFDKENQCNYCETKWSILYEQNRFKETIDKLVGKEVYEPQITKAKFADLKLTNNAKIEIVVINSLPGILDKEAPKDHTPASSPIKEPPIEDQPQVIKKNDIVFNEKLSKPLKKNSRLKRNKWKQSKSKKNNKFSKKSILLPIKYK